MKNVIIIVMLVICAILLANPIELKFVSEIYFDENDDWTIELASIFTDISLISSDVLIGNTYEEMTLVESFTITEDNNGIFFTKNNLAEPVDFPRSTGTIFVRVDLYETVFNYGSSSSLMTDLDDGEYAGQVCVEYGEPMALTYFLPVKKLACSIGESTFNGSTNSSLEVTVLDSLANPISDIDLELTPSQYYNLNTNENGKAIFTDLYATGYRIKCSDYEQEYINEIVIVEPGDNFKTYQIESLVNNDNVNSILNNNVSCYPNPLYLNTDEYTNFKVEKLRSNDKVSVEIYNLKGQLIQQIKDSSNGLRWYGKSIGNKEVSSGVYFSKIKINNDVITKKIVLIKE